MPRIRPSWTPTTKAHLISNGNYVAEWDVPCRTRARVCGRGERNPAQSWPRSATRTARGVTSGDNLGSTQNNGTRPVSRLPSRLRVGQQPEQSRKGNASPRPSSTASPPTKAEFLRAAARYMHYLHGVNPFSLVYLSNMNEHGAENSDNDFSTPGSPTRAPPGIASACPPTVRRPGYLVGGPNPSYDWDGCCPNGCGTPQ